MAFDPLTAILDTGKTVLNKFVADKMPEVDRLKLENDFELETRRQAANETSDFYKFVTDYAGSATDYKDIPVIGPLMLLIRGLVRPSITYATAYFDWILFTGGADWSPEKIALLGKINIIVLAFWFGDRIINSSGVANIIDKLGKK